MVFDKDAAKSPQGEKRSRDREDHITKQQVEHRRSEEKKENGKPDRHRQNDHSREYKEKDRKRDRRPSQGSRSLRDVEYHEQPMNSDRDVEYHEETRNRDKYMQKNGHGDESRRQRDDQDYRKRRSESDTPSKERVCEGKIRENDGNGTRDSRDESRHKRSGHADDSKGSRKEIDCGKRGIDYDEGRDRERN